LDLKSYDIKILSDKYSPSQTEALSSLKKHGMLKFSLSSMISNDLIAPTSDIDELLSSSTLEPSIIKSGYSHPIEVPMYLYPIIESIGQLLASSKLARNYLFRPSLVNILSSLSTFNKEAVSDPTHAHLWHRDADDIGRQLKLFIPLNKCGPDNGMFSALSSSCINYYNYILDKRLILRSDSEDDEYRKSDRTRINDSVLRRSFNDFIYDFKAMPGEALLIDTNRCYHKGGLVTQDGMFRQMVQVTVGSPTHTWLENSFDRRLLRFLRHQWYRLNRFLVQKKDIYLM